MPTPNASPRFLVSPGLMPEAAMRIRTSPAEGVGSGISPTCKTSRAGPCFSYQAAFIEVPQKTLTRPEASHVQIQGTRRHGRLSDLYEVPVRVAHVASQLRRVNFWLGDEFRAASTPKVVA